MELDHGRKQGPRETRPRLAAGDAARHEGTLRSQFGETSEAIFLNSGYIYASAEQAEARFKGDEEGYVYSRYANPTVSMFPTKTSAIRTKNTPATASRGTTNRVTSRARYSVPKKTCCGDPCPPTSIITALNLVKT